MGNVKQIKQRRLFDFILDALVGVIAGEKGLSHGVEQIRIKNRGIINFGGLANGAYFVIGIVDEIAANTQRADVSAAAEAMLQGNDHFHRMSP